MQFGSALITLFDAVLVKSAVMLLTAWLLVVLWRSMRAVPAPMSWLRLADDESQEMRWLWWSLVMFAVSEVTCTVEIAALGSKAMDGTHSVSSSIGMGLFAVWLVRYLDRKIVRYGEPACVLNRICHGCTFSEAERCKFLNTGLYGAGFVAAAALVPLFVSTAPIPADPRVWTLPLPGANAWYDRAVVPWVRASFPHYDPTSVSYAFPRSTLIIELRVIPLVAATLALVAFAMMKAHREVRGFRVLAFGAGLLGYVYLEIAVFSSTREPIFGSIAHELAELWFLLVTKEILDRSFGRARRGTKPAHA
ncbi:MAG: hypothetical protein WCJ30_04280 [Deltaproteobacteria bacterium]